MSVPHIQVTFLPLPDFQDLASVTFDIEDGKKHGCAEGEYKQLLSEPNPQGVQQIHVMSPLISCYLAGKGVFATEKMYSVNKLVEPVWPDVSLYAMAKFILNRLMNRRFDMDILYRRNTKTFLQQLGNSDYSNFLGFFEREKDYEKYFLW